MRGASVESKQGGARVRLPPPLVFLAAVVVGWFLPGLRMAGPGRLAGLLLVSGGLAMGMSAVGWFRKTGQDPKPWLPSPVLILEGAYRYMRNPMYSGMVVIAVGIALLAGRLWIAVLAPLALLVVHFTAVLPEERYLTAKFGAAYTEYTSRVRRYL
jgi:protein-S-isoprenylcysteine O-methyltransferase Ste14